MTPNLSLGRKEKKKKNHHAWEAFRPLPFEIVNTFLLQAVTTPFLVLYRYKSPRAGFQWWESVLWGHFPLLFFDLGRGRACNSPCWLVDRVHTTGISNLPRLWRQSLTSWIFSQTRIPSDLRDLPKISWSYREEHSGELRVLRFFAQKIYRAEPMCFLYR